jgi:hypothetical protein
MYARSQEGKKKNCQEETDRECPKAIEFDVFKQKKNSHHLNPLMRIFVVSGDQAGVCWLVNTTKNQNRSCMDSSADVDLLSGGLSRTGNSR